MPWNEDSHANTNKQRISWFPSGANKFRPSTADLFGKIPPLPLSPCFSLPTAPAGASPLPGHRPPSWASQWWWWSSARDVAEALCAGTVQKPRNVSIHVNANKQWFQPWILRWCRSSSIHSIQKFGVPSKLPQSFWNMVCFAVGGPFLAQFDVGPMPTGGSNFSGRITMIHKPGIENPPVRDPGELVLLRARYYVSGFSCKPETLHVCE